MCCSHSSLCGGKLFVWYTGYHREKLTSTSHLLHAFNKHAQANAHCKHCKFASADLLCSIVCMVFNYTHIICNDAHACVQRKKGKHRRNTYRQTNPSVVLPPWRQTKTTSETLHCTVTKYTWSLNNLWCVALILQVQMRQIGQYVLFESREPHLNALDYDRHLPQDGVWSDRGNGLILHLFSWS